MSELDLTKSIAESYARNCLETIREMEEQEVPGEDFAWNKEQLSEIKQTAELLVSRINQLEVMDLQEEE